MRSLGIYIYSCLVDGCMCWVGWLVVLGNVIVTYRWMYIYIYIYTYVQLTACHCVGAHTLIYIQVCMSNFSYTCHKQLFYSVYVNFESYVQILHIHVCPELLDMLIELLVQVLLLCLP